MPALQKRCCRRADSTTAERSACRLDLTQRVVRCFVQVNITVSFGVAERSVMFGVALGPFSRERFDVGQVDCC